MTKTCLQCGAVQPSNVRACSFCDSTFLVESSAQADFSAPNPREIALSKSAPGTRRPASTSATEETWRGELAQRLQAYRARRRKTAPNLAQGDLPFENQTAPPEIGGTVALDERDVVGTPQRVENDGFSFTIAIGRNAATREDSRMDIDVSLPPAPEESAGLAPAKEDSTEQGLYPVAPIEERRLAGLVDAACLMFAYGGFLTLFGSLGGQFTLSKLSAVVCVTTFVIVYLQYFALFTVFGGTTPGMMLRDLHVVSFSGDTPTPRQMLWRSLGYMLSAGTLFMGFLWALWDEDGLTWHDRLSQTFLARVPIVADLEATHVAHGR